ncbi:MAG: membrane protein insertase YidC [Candidatus Didemnitutus sp.]|nr:membrane protein insertase YidC [Candidatus Didemnitutus sp.]
MDKKNTVIGVLLIIAAMAAFYYSAKIAPQPQPRPAIETAPATSPIARNQAPVGGPASSPHDAALTAPARDTAPAEFVTVANEFISVKFTNAGGAIDSIALLKHAAVKGDDKPYVLNALHAAPALSLVDFPGADQDARYQLVSRTSTEVVYRARANEQLEITRRYTLLGNGNGDPYQIRHETTFRNLANQPLPLPRGAINIGTAAPVNAEDFGLYLNVGYWDGEDFEHVERSKLEGGGFLSGFGFGSKVDLPFIDRPAAIMWASVKNQFFASILTPDEPGTGMRIARVKVYPQAPVEDKRAYGVSGIAYFEVKPLAANSSTTWGATYFAGPKEYTRLSNTENFKHDEDKAMQFGFFGWFAKLLITIMSKVHSWIGGDSLKWGWGWSIVITTLCLKIFFVPFTLAASRSSKRMAKLAPMLTEIRAKHKDSPQKAQEAMMRLYKDYKVNPLGGCIPVLITIPFFIGFFSMLQSTSELRFAAFLWASDLSAPDTIARILGFPLNIMPLLMGGTMIVQMRLTPMPSTDNMQATMFKIMPWIFTLFCYNFSCALALYSTVNGLFTIGQQMFINRLPEPELEKRLEADPKAKMKNVTPKKKK